MEHFLQIAELRVAPSPAVLRTVVGSCIALCLFDRTRTIGGMVHILMPVHDGDGNGAPGRYADTAVPALVREMEKAGCAVPFLEAALFGGAAMFAFGANGIRTIGLRNAGVVKDRLAEFAIPVRREEVGGTSGRRVVFHCATGRLDVSVLNKPAWASPPDGADGKNGQNEKHAGNEKARHGSHERAAH
jgi:chemotaxis protein CheD